jgi:hypothetical protein
LITCQSAFGVAVGVAEGFAAAAGGAGLGFAFDNFGAVFARAPHARLNEIAPAREKMGNRTAIIH